MLEHKTYIENIDDAVSRYISSMVLNYFLTLLTLIHVLTLLPFFIMCFIYISNVFSEHSAILHTSAQIGAIIKYIKINRCVLSEVFVCIFAQLYATLNKILTHIL